jgi:hypothetical protein
MEIILSTLSGLTGMEIILSTLSGLTGMEIILSTLSGLTGMEIILSTLSGLTGMEIELMVYHIQSTASMLTIKPSKQYVVDCRMMNGNKRVVS